MMQKIKTHKGIGYCVIIILMIAALTYIYYFNPIDKVNNTSELMTNSEYLVTGPVYHEYLSNGKATYGLGMYLPTNGLPENLNMGRYLTDEEKHTRGGVLFGRKCDCSCG